jgi:hypothetical protein
MDADELKLLDSALLSLTASEEDGQITAALDAFGWRDMLVARPEEAISALFDVQGRTGTWSAALHDVLGNDVESLGITRPVCVVLPRPRCSHPGALGEGGEGTVTVDGILLGPRDAGATLVVTAGSAGPETLVVAIEPEDLQIERRQGLDPGLVPTPCPEPRRAWRCSPRANGGPGGGRRLKLSGAWPCVGRSWRRCRS